MEAGKKNCKFIIQIATIAPDSHGTEIQTWQTHKTWWAGLRTISGGESYVNQQFVASATHRLEGGYVRGITPRMRILYGTRTFDILQVMDVGERHADMWLVCKELV
jgi:SPP1 family predicted phage head-tail adaptor